MKTPDEIMKNLADEFAHEMSTLVTEHVGELEKALDMAHGENEKLMARLMELKDAAKGKDEQIAALQSAISQMQKAPGKTIVKKIADAVKGEIRHKVFDRVVRWLNARRNVLLVGDAGCGKTHLAQQVAKAMGLDFYMTSKVEESFDVKGFVDGNGVYHETEFYKAVKHGGLFLFDEFDASSESAVMVLNNALSNGYVDFQNERVEVHENFRCIATANTFGNGADETYTTRSVLDAATLNRFVAIEVGYDERIELQCAGGDKEIVEFARDLRSAMKKCGYNRGIVSYRNISDLRVGVEIEDTLSDAISSCICKGISNDDIRMIAAQMMSLGKYSMEFKKLGRRMAA